MTNNEIKVLAALRANIEAYEYDDQAWGSVYLDNARPDGMSNRSFAGILSSLCAKGFYRSQDDDCFGYVKMSDD